MKSLVIVPAVKTGIRHRSREERVLAGRLPLPDKVFEVLIFFSILFVERRHLAGSAFIDQGNCLERAAQR